MSTIKSNTEVVETDCLNMCDHPKPPVTNYNSKLDEIKEEDTQSRYLRLISVSEMSSRTRNIVYTAA